MPVISSGQNQNNPLALWPRMIFVKYADLLNVGRGPCHVLRTAARTLSLTRLPQSLTTLFIMSAIIFGATGLCGSEILKQSVALAKFKELTSVTRRELDFSSDKLKKIVEKDSSKYPELAAASNAQVLFSSLATTRAAAGSAEKFVEIDHDINLNVAKAAKESGTKTIVLISSVGASASSPFLYMKTKGRLEDDVIALKFPQTIILRPGPLLGEREKSKGWLNDLSAGTFKLFHNTFIGNNVIYPIFGHEVGKAAVHLAEQSLDESSEEPQVKIVGGKELISLAKLLE